MESTKRDVLVVEPHPGFKTLFAALLQEEMKLSINIVENKDQALYLIENLGFSYKCCVVSIDDFTGTLDGYDFMDELRDRDSSIGVIASGIVDKALYNRLKGYPSVDFLKKDFTSNRKIYNHIYFLKYVKRLHKNNFIKLKLFIDEESDQANQVKALFDSFKIKNEIEIINLKKHKDLAEKYKIMAIPTLIRELPEPKMHFLGSFTQEQDILKIIS